MRKSKLVQYIIDNDYHSTYWTGTVLWYDESDGYGIVESGSLNGSEIYIDRSVLPSGVVPKSGDRLEFKINTSITDCACAHSIKTI